MTFLLRPLAAAALLLCAQGVAAQTLAAQTLAEEQPGPLLLPDLSDPNAPSAGVLDTAGARAELPMTLRGSAARAGGPANGLNPGGRAEAPVPARGDLVRVVAGRELFHGNYCGTGQRGVGLEPTDALDAACMHHDACYDAAGHRSCACDASLKRETAALSDDPSAPLEIRRRALSVTEATVAMGCQSP